MPDIRRIILVWLVVSTSWVLSGCAEPEHPPLRVGTVVWPGYEPLYLARANGDLPESAVRLIEYPSASEVIRALRNRSLEGAALTLDEVLMVVSEDTPLKVVLVMDISHGGDVLLAHPSVRSMGDLRGKRVGVESTALGAFMLTRALQTHGLDVSDIDVRNMDVNAHENAYLLGEVDAIVTFEPARTRLLNAGAQELFTSRDIPGEIVDVLVVHEAVLEHRLADLRQLADTWFRAVDILRQRPDDAATVMSRRLRISPREVLASYDGLVLPTRTENQLLLGGPQPALRDTVLRLNQVLVDAGLLDRPVSGTDLIDGAVTD